VSKGLGVWIWLPVAALVFLLLVIVSTPGSNCEGSPEDLGGSEAVTAVIAGAFAVGLAFAAAKRVLALRRADRLPIWQLVVAAAAVAVLPALAGLVDIARGVPFLWTLVAFGALATFAMLFALIFAWAARSKPDDVGVLLPAYLLSGAVFVFPGLTVLSIGLESGSLC
jgi:hypothetical protein